MALIRLPQARLPLLALLCCTLLVAATLVRAQDDESSTGVDEDVSSSTGDDSSSSSSTGDAEVVNPDYVSFTYYVCGSQKTNASLGYYDNGKAWESPTAVDYIDSTNTNNASRGYEQCWGRGTTTNCFDNWNSSKARSFAPAVDTSLKYIKGDASPPIYLYFGGGHRLLSMRFFPIVDQFALLQIQNSFNYSQPSGVYSGARNSFAHLGSVFQVELGGLVTDYRHRYGTITSSECVDTVVNGTTTTCTYSGGTTCLVVPFWTILITLKSGVIQSIAFDDDDSTCGSSYSVDGNCGVAVSDCTDFTLNGVSTGGTTDCAFKLYVAWAGTDNDGTYLSSTGRRLSQFRKWSLHSVYNQASTLSISDLPVAAPASDGSVV